MQDLRAVRSILSVPAHDARKVAKARTRGADLIMWDLESSVPANAKDEALVAVIHEAAPGDAVRLYGPCQEEQMEALRDRDLAFVIPHVISSNDLLFVDDMECFIPLIESAAGVSNVEEIMRTLVITPALCLVGLAFGRWDFEAAIGFPCPALLNHARGQIALTAHAHGIACWDAPAALSATRSPGVWPGPSEAREARSLGFTGKGCVHPSQILDVHRAWELPVDWSPMPFAAPGAPV